MIGGVRKYFKPGFELWRFTSTTDDYGGPTEKFTKQSDLTGRLRPLSGDRRLSADKDTEFATHKFYCTPSDIRVGDQIRKSTDHYEVKFAPDMMSMGRLMQVELELVVNG